MKYLLSLPIFKEKNNSILTRENVLFGPLPFYGIGNSIYAIIEKEECYYKVLYNQDGTINPQMLPVAKKKKKNLELLKRDYCHDLSKCIEKKKPLYEEYLNNNYIPKLSNKNYYLYLIISIIINIISIPYIFTTSFIGIIISTISILAFCIITDIHKKDNLARLKELEYISNFEKLENELTSLQTNDKKKIIEFDTKPHLEVKSIANIPKKTLPKVRTLSNQDLMKAA